MIWDMGMWLGQEVLGLLSPVSITSHFLVYIQQNSTMSYL